MKMSFPVFAIPLCVMLAASPVRALDDTDDLKAVAIEALITAPENRALPIVTKLLRSDEDVDLKSRALFVLGQMKSNDAVSLIVEMAQSQDRAIQSEAIRMIGVGGNRAALDAIKEIYLTGDRNVRQNVLEAYLIAGDSDGILKIAQSAENSEDFEDAVEMLGAMGASVELTALRGQFGSSEALIEAYGVAGDFDSLATIAQDNSDPGAQIQALQGLGIVGGERVGELLTRIFRTTADADVKEAALEGLLIAGDTQSLVTLFRAVESDAEKRQVLETLVVTDGDAALEIVDEVLGKTE